MQVYLVLIVFSPRGPRDHGGRRGTMVVLGVCWGTRVDAEGRRRTLGDPGGHIETLGDSDAVYSVSRELVCGCKETRSQGNALGRAKTQKDSVGRKRKRTQESVNSMLPK